MLKKFVENYENLTDEEIVSNIKLGNYELLNVIISRYNPTIFYYINTYCKDCAEDAVQEATLALYSAIKSYDAGKASFLTFANLCIKRAVLDYIKVNRRKKNIPNELISSIEEVEVVDSNTPEKIFFDKIDYNNLAETIKLELSALEYNVLQLYLAGERYCDIASELSITEKAVDNSLARIRKKLRK